MKPTAVILSAATGYGGAERSLETLLPLLAQDYDIYILVQNRRHLQACRRVAMDCPRLHVSVLRGGFQFFQLVRGLLWLLTAWVRHEPSFVMANNNKSAMIIALASVVAPSLTIRTVLYIRDFEWRYRSFVFKRLQRALFLIPSQAILDARGYLAPWVKPRGRSHCEIVMNAVTMETRDWEERAGGPYILLPGTVQEWKGHEYVIRALARTPLGLRAVFVGDVQDRDYHARLIALAEALNVSDRIEFRVFDFDILQVLHDSLCVIVASVARSGGPETFGRTVIEAWSMRRPVVAFAVGGPLYLIEDRVNGILVPEGDVTALGDAIVELMENAELAESLATNGYCRVQDFTPDRIYHDFRNAVEFHLNS